MRVFVQTLFGLVAFAPDPARAGPVGMSHGLDTPEDPSPGAEDSHV